jgi:prolipoprotein diacylglyceryl transferase
MNLPLIHWSFDPVFFSIGPIAVRWYGLLWASAFLLGQQLLGWMCRRENISGLDLDRLFIFALLGTVIGSRLVHCLAYEPEFYLANPLEILKPWRGGMASHGGALGLITGLWLGLRKQTVPSYLWLLDRVAIPSALGATLIRIANFLGSDILGLPTGGDWGVVFDLIDALPRHPVQLYEAAAYLVTFVVLLSIYRRRGDKTPHGLLTGLFLTLVFSARVGLEIFKTPQASYETGFELHVGQWLSLPFIALGIGLIRRALR